MNRARGAAVALGLSAALAASGCRMDRWRAGGEGVGTGGSATGDTPPPETTVTTAKRVGEADAKAREGRSASFELDERTGRPRPTLVLRLDYFPEPRPGSTNLPACLPPLAGDTEIGLAACEAKSIAAGEGGEPVLVFAKNLDQDCYTDMRRARVPAKEPLQLKDCRRAYVAVAGFDPKLRVDVELK